MDRESCTRAHGEDQKTVRVRGFALTLWRGELSGSSEFIFVRAANK